MNDYDLGKFADKLKRLTSREIRAIEKVIDGFIEFKGRYAQISAVKLVTSYKNKKIQKNLSQNELF